MDSGNSSSMQSSSGGGGDQEEYDSRADQSISALFNNSTTVSSNIAGQTQLDSLIANYFNTGWSTDNHTLWPTTTTTKPTDGGSRPPPAPSSSEPAFFTSPLQENLRVVSNTNTSSPTICSVPTDKKNGLATTRNLKKRSRVSRRAPTTVLTTDTSNFRAMVQEFTGNPSTPFTGSLSSSSFPRSRFDLFHPSSSSRPLKPFPQKLIIPPSSASHHYLNPPSSNYHQSHLLNMCTQNIAHPLRDQSLSLRTSNGVGHVDVGTNFEGLHNIIASSSSSMTHPTLNTMHGLDMVPVQRSDVYSTPVASGTENNLGVVRNEGTVDLSWISSSSD